MQTTLWQRFENLRKFEIWKFSITWIAVKLKIFLLCISSSIHSLLSNQWAPNSSTGMSTRLQVIWFCNFFFLPMYVKFTYFYVVQLDTLSIWKNKWSQVRSTHQQFINYNNNTKVLLVYVVYIRQRMRLGSESSSTWRGWCCCKAVPIISREHVALLPLFVSLCFCLCSCLCFHFSLFPSITPFFGLPTTLLSVFKFILIYILVLVFLWRTQRHKRQTVSANKKLCKLIYLLCKIALYFQH